MRFTQIAVLTPAAVLAVMLTSHAATAQTAAAKTPPPTSADWTALAKLPDFTGVWEIGFGGGGGGRGRGAAPQGPALTPAAAAKRKELQSLGREDNQTANCVPPGMPGIMGQPYPMEFLLTPGKVTIVIEAYTQVRHIYTDGRPHIGEAIRQYLGDSRARWEGDELVVVTTNLTDKTSIGGNGNGLRHSDKMVITERFKRVAADVLQYQFTVDDPVTYARPFTMSMPLTPLDGGVLLPYECHEGNYGLPHALSAERAEDKAIEEDRKNGIVRARRAIQVPVPNRPAAPAEEN